MNLAETANDNGFSVPTAVHLRTNTRRSDTEDTLVHPHAIPSGAVQRVVQEDQSNTPSSYFPATLMCSEEYSALAGQFGTFVLVVWDFSYLAMTQLTTPFSENQSTFTATLIIGFLSLARDIISSNDTDTRNLNFEVGMFLSLLATGSHIGVIIIAGRAAALCMRLAAHTRFVHHIDLENSFRENSKPGFKPKVSSLHDIAALNLHEADFYLYVTYCERLQLSGTICLGVTIIFLTFSIFQYRVFPVLLVTAAVCGSLAVCWMGFWKLSVTREYILSILKDMGIMKKNEESLAQDT